MGLTRLIHIGRKVPKGYEELPGGIHLGKGMWMLPMCKIKDSNEKSKRNKSRSSKTRV